MAWFRRDDAAGVRSLLGDSAGDLDRIGRLAFGGDSPHAPGTSGVPIADLDRYAIAALDGTGYPTVGTAGWDAKTDRVLLELSRAAAAGGPWATVGAVLVGWNCLLEDEVDRPAFLSLLDAALLVLRDDGVASTALPPYALARWEATQGRDGPAPRGWPSTLEPLDVPAHDATAGVEPPDTHELRRLAVTGDSRAARTYYAEHRAPDRLVVVIEGIDQSDDTSKRWDWPTLEAPDYVGLLRDLGERLGTRPWWSHDDLEPFFPWRPRSRDEMRRAAAALR
ncbi:MAG: hypothetical protein AAGC46_00380 [Solirubrobacteraceae bacterium]